ncbi:MULTISPECIES: transcription termination factor NusA [Hyphomonas]|jgi:N utilization substance protein A|uniref:Transcription termination/antitermination protein NusA n=1 Tax=Hyphomonas atlantica TaxID=1280948 RepID=A0A059EA47_9PROT|nr:MULTISPECIES: transcription termination factor NusA [Hyphomonas]KCZ64465.1 transcription elongation factor NusA [Hyphomonas atlantica]MAH91545.1 transcription termination/antitermination protein NusA [Hyphomonas sp.]MAM06014.1 transcription termination/antitermination protein NusA [Hyphomonas sp.]HAE93187.1 transcription termination/antitermination protein NusA [Hyphomonas atlantica]HBF90070.1 transcription termination/antitermination protein NusA [Hyphomonas atlantica]|tara:strand:+ start:1190 stop:2956 length:1767 start_codon:yes stop_codon:yes gene_type:complete
MSTIGVSANRLEILQIAKAVAEEKAIDQTIVIEAMQEAIEKAAKAKYGQEHDIRAKIDATTGEQTLWRVQTVVADDAFEDEAKELRLSEAKKLDETLEAGDELKEELPPFDFGRVAAQTAKQVIMQKVRDAERERQYNEYKDRVGEVISGVVKRVEYGHVIVDLGRAEGIIRRNDGIPRENFQTNDRVRAYLYKVSRETKGPQIFLSRAAPDFMVRLFAQEVPEVYEGVIEIKACSRDPGSRAKIGVISNDSSIDPVGACVGMRGARVQAVVGELSGEKIDIIPWNYDDATFIVNALQPAEVSKVVLDEEERRVEVVVADDQFPLAIGRRGQNVRLASQLTGWQIDLVTETADSERYQREFQERTDLFMKALDADETLAQLLASEGFETVEEIAYVAPEDFITIEGFDEDVAEELQERAREFLERLAAENDAKRRELGVEDAVMELEGMSPSFAVRLGEEGVQTLDDVAGLVPDDITGWREPGPDGKPVWVEGVLKKGEMRKDDAQMFIMRARVAAGWIEPDALEQMLAEQAKEEEPELTEEERALLALGELGSNPSPDAVDEALEELEFDLDALAAEGGDDEAAPQE